MKYLIVLVGLLFMYSAQAQNEDNQVIDKIAGVVGDNIVLISDVEAQFAQLAAQGAVAGEEAKCEVFNELLLEKLMVVKAERDSIVIGDEEVEAELDRRLRYFISLFGTREKLEEYYEKSVPELKEDFRQDIYDQILAQRVQQGIVGTVKVSPAEVKAFFNKIPSDSLPFYNAEVEVSQIVVYPKVSEVQRQFAIEKIEKIRKDLEGGSNFEFLATAYSEDPGSAANGGLLGFVERGEMVNEFEAAAFRLREGEISEVVKTQFGYHLIKLDEKRGTKLKLRHILITPRITSYEMETAKSLLDSVRALIVSDTMSWDKAVVEFSEDKLTKNAGGNLMSKVTGSTTIEMSELEPQVAFVVEQLEAEQLSDVMPFTSADGRNQQGFRLLKLKSETEAHRADLQKDYGRIQAAAIQEKKQSALKDWIVKERRGTFVQINEDFNCGNLDQWKSSPLK